MSTRVLLVSAPLAGHVLPLVPLGRELVAAGHDVLVATAGDGLTALEDAGLATFDVDPQADFGRIARRVMLTRPRLAAAELAGRGGTRVVSLLFGTVAQRMLGRLADVAGRWRPDVVVHE